MIKVVIVGCGKVAEQHAAQIKRINKAILAGVCDIEKLMAIQMQERFDVKFATDDLNELINHVRPDVVHITTPPQTHFHLAKICLEAGCHVYVEKPFTINAQEAEELINCANKKGLKLTVGHNMQFTLAAERMRRLIAAGFLGGPPIHIEAYYGYDLGDPNYAKALLSDQKHWVRNLPGGLIQNIISHAVAKIAEFLIGEDINIISISFVSNFIKKLNERAFLDELRVIILDSKSTTAYLTFSTQMKPSLHQVRIFGPKNGIEIDDDHQTLIKLKGTNYKSYLEQLISPFSIAKDYFKQGLSNVKAFLKQELHNDMGMKRLIEMFYRSIEKGDPLPIPYREIILTSRIIDKILEKIRKGN